MERDHGRQGQSALSDLLGRALCVAGSGGLGALLVLDLAKSDAALVSVVLVASLVVGLGFVVGGPALQSVVPLLVKPDELASAMALNTAPGTIARVAGPVVAAAALQSVGPGWSLVLSGVTHAVCFTILFVISIPEPDHGTGESRDVSIRSALSFVWHDRKLVDYLAVVAIAAVGAEPSLTFAPALADALAGGTALVGCLAAAFGAGAVVGVGVTSAPLVSTRPAAATLVGIGTLALGLAILSATTTVAGALSGFCLAGLGFSIALTSATTQVQRRSPADMRGRIMGLWIVAFVGARPLGSVSLGAMADQFSISAALTSLATLLGVATLCGASSVWIRRAGRVPQEGRTRLTSR